MKARIRRLSASVDSPTIVIDQPGASTDESHRAPGSDGTSPSESRIDRMKKLLSSPLSRRKSSTSSNPNTTSGTSAKTFGATLSSLAYHHLQQQQEQDHCPSSLASFSTSSHSTITTSAPSMTVSQTEPRSFLSAPTMQSSMFQSMDIPSSDQNISTTLSPNLSFDASSLSPSPPITLSSYHVQSRVKRMKQPGIPFIISRLCNYIESNSGLTLEGLFRVSGNVKLVEKLKNSFDKFGDAPLETIGDVPSAAALVKLFLRELPEPVIPTSVHRSFLSVLQDQTDLVTNREKSLERLKELIDTKLPPENYYTLKYLCSFLHRVCMNESSNRMNSSSLGIVFGPNLFRLSADDYKDLKEKAISGPNILVSTFISDHEVLFSSNHHPLGSSSAYSSLGYDTSDQTSIDPESIPSSSFDHGSDLKGERFASLLDGRIRMEEVSVRKSGQMGKDKNKKSSTLDTQMISTSIDLSSKFSSGSKLSSSSEYQSKSSEKSNPNGSKKSKYSLPKIIPLLTLSKIDQGSSSIFGSSSKHRFGKKRKATTGSLTSPSSSCQNIPLESGSEHSSTTTLGSMMIHMRPPIHAELLRSCSEERASPNPVLEEQDGQADVLGMRRCKSSEAVLKLSSSLADSDSSPKNQSRDLADVCSQEDEDDTRNLIERPVDASQDVSSSVTTESPNLITTEYRPPSNLSSQPLRVPSSTSPDFLHPPIDSSVDDFTSSHDSLASCSLLDDFMNASIDRRKSSDEILGTKRKNSLKGKLDSPGPSILRPSSIDRVKRMESIKKCSDQLPDLVLVCGEPNNNDGIRCRESGEDVDSSLNIVITRTEDEDDPETVRYTAGVGSSPEVQASKRFISPPENLSPDVGHRNSWPGAVKDSHSPVKDVKDCHKGRDSIDSTASSDGSKVTGVNNSYPLTNSLVNQLKMSENNPFEAPSSPSAFRAYLAQRSKRLSDPSSAPSPPIDHQFNGQQQYGCTSSKYCSSSAIVKEAKRRISSLKRDLKDFETSYERRNGSKPTHDVKINSPIAKPLLLELGKLRKGLKEMKEDHNFRRDLLDLEVMTFKNTPDMDDRSSRGCSSNQSCPFLSSLIRSHHKKSPSSPGRHLYKDDIDFLPFKSSSDALSAAAVANADSDLLIECLNELQVTLRSKRLLAARPDSLDSMTTEQVIGEKLDLQKALLKFESTYGRPATKKERDVMRPVYDRYRSVKRIVARMPKTSAVPAPGIVTSGSDSDLQPILENVVMSFESPMPSNNNAQVCLTSSPKKENVPHEVAAGNSPSSFHELSLMQLLGELNESRIEKKKLRRSIKSAEEDYTMRTGKKMDKEDRSDRVQSIYNDYKHVKGKLRLLEALVLKREREQNPV